MISSNTVFVRIALFSIAAGILFAGISNQPAQAATVFYQAGASGGGSQVAFAPTTAVSGTMTAPVPRFNGLLGTLIQADFEFAGSATDTWVSTTNQIGTSTLSITGPADVDGQPMGNVNLGFVGAYDNLIGSNDFDLDYVNLTVTSGAFFNSLTGVGTFPMNWVYAGNTTLDTPAVGTSPGNEGFSWGGSVHVLYTYAPVPEPGTLALAVAGLAAFLLVASTTDRSSRGHY